jgi:phage-related protein (TIGR01555 family)
MVEFQDGLNSFLSNFGKTNSIANTATGVGLPRDPSTTNCINPPSILSHIEAQNLYRSSKVIENIICKVPDAAIASLVGWDITGSNKQDADFTRDYYAWLQELGFFEALREACYSARLLGDGFILLDVNDGLDASEEVNYNTVKSLDFLVAKGQDECFPTDSWLYPQQYTINRFFDTPQQGAKSSTLVYHRSRLIHLIGKRLFGNMLRQNGGRNDSILNQIFQAFARWETSQSDVKNMLGTHSLMSFAVKGLSRLVSTCEGKASLWGRFEAMMMSLNVMKGIPYDAETEKVEFINRNFSGVKDAIEILSESLLSATDLPSYIVFGSTHGTAFSESGLSERLAFDQVVQQYNRQVITPALAAITKFARLLKDCPAYKKQYIEPVFNSTISLTDLEQADLYKRLSEGDSNYLTNGVLDAETIKDSRFSQSGKIGLFIQQN